MLFRSKTAPKTWDGWIYHARGTYRLYYLISDRHVCDGFGLATSVDGVAWYNRGWVLRHSEQMVRYLGIGSVWRNLGCPEAKAYICNYSEWRMEQGRTVQRLLFASSDDLIAWDKAGDDHAFHIDERYYKRTEPAARGP